MRGSFSYWESHKCDFIVKTHEISTPSIRLFVGSSIDLYPRCCCASFETLELCPSDEAYSERLFLLLLSRPFFPLIADLERFCFSFTWKINHSSCPVACPLHYESTGCFEPYQACCYEWFELFASDHTSPFSSKMLKYSERVVVNFSGDKTWGIIPKQRTNLVSISERLRALHFLSDRACGCKKIIYPFCSDCLGLFCISGFAVSALIADSRYKYSEFESARSWALAMSTRSK